MLSTEQKQIRAGGLSGSEMAAVCAIYPWAAPIDVYESKVGNAPPIEWKDHDGLIRGTLFEAPVAQWYALKTEREVVRPATWARTDTDTLVHPEHPIVIATPDGISVGPGSPDIVLEVKCPGWRMGHHWGDEGTDQIPEYYLPQVTWEMAVTGLRVAHVVAYLGDAPRVYRVNWDQDLFEAMLETAERFWVDHVLARVPPPVDGTEAYTAWIARNHPQKLSTYRPMDATIEPWVQKLMSLRELAKSIEEQERLCRNHIELFIGEAAGLDCGPLGRIDWKKNKDSAVVDWKQLCRDYLPTVLGENDDVIAGYTKTRDGNRPFTPRFAKGA